MLHGLSGSMRGRWASAAIGAGIARNRAEARANEQMEQQKANYEQQINQLKGSQEPSSQPQNSSGQEDVTVKLRKIADLKKEGILTEEEFQKMKAELIAKL